MTQTFTFISALLSERLDWKTIINTHGNVSKLKLTTQGETENFEYSDLLFYCCWNVRTSFQKLVRNLNLNFTLPTVHLKLIFFNKLFKDFPFKLVFTSTPSTKTPSVVHSIESSTTKELNVSYKILFIRKSPSTAHSSYPSGVRMRSY